MFLKPSERKINGKSYKYYNLVESVRSNGKVKHNILVPLGVLTDEKANLIREIIKASGESNGPSVAKYRLDEIIVTKNTDFLNIYVLHKLWCDWGFDTFFREYQFIEKLVINRCINPMSKLRATQWEDGELIDLLNLRQTPNHYGAYDELDRIYQIETEKQKHISWQLTMRNMMFDSAIFYDITSTFFFFFLCTLAFRGYSLDHRPDKLQILIAMAVTAQGYPFYWKVYEGNTPDVSTIEDFTNQIIKLFGLSDFVFVFDRGMTSQDNIDYIEEKGFSFISTIDRNEIVTSTPANIEQFRGVNENTDIAELENFAKYDSHLWYREYHSDKHRYILGFSVQKQQDERKTQQARLMRFEQQIQAQNNDLRQAKRSRKRETVEKNIETFLKKTKVKRAIQITIEDMPITHGKKSINSFYIAYTVDASVLEDKQLTDGLTCFYTNTCTRVWSAEKVIRQYREKNIIEEGFREIKGIMELRPIYLSRFERVCAHVTICVLAYLLYNTLEKRVSKLVESSASDMLDELAKCKVHTITTKSGIECVKTLTRFTEKQISILKHLEHKPKVIEDHFKRLILN
jgi:transposase